MKGTKAAYTPNLFQIKISIMIARAAIAAAITLGLISCDQSTSTQSPSTPSKSVSAPASTATPSTTSASATASVKVYKSPTCACCGKWVDHLDGAGFTSKVHDTQDLNSIKASYQIPPRYQSCHTALIDDYVFEGHIPASIIQKFLAEKPAGSLGLTVPGMPVGSPGMEMGNRYDDYDVLLLKNDGTTEVYQQVRHHKSF